MLDRERQDGSRCGMHVPLQKTTRQGNHGSRDCRQLRLTGNGSALPLGVYKYLPAPLRALASRQSSPGRPLPAIPCPHRLASFLDRATPGPWTTRAPPSRRRRRLPQAGNPIRLLFSASYRERRSLPCWRLPDCWALGPRAARGGRGRRWPW